MRTLCYLLCLLLFVACKSNKKGSVADSTARTPIAIGSITPYALNKDYTVIDTGSYGDDGPMAGGHYLVITKNKSVVDTIDLCFGMKELADNVYLYQNIRSTAPLSGMKLKHNELWANTADYLIIDDGHKTPLSKMLFDFDNYFSSPSIIGKKLYYWHLNKADSLGTFKVSAAQFNPVTKQTKRFYLFNDALGTDDSGYFCPPYVKNDTVYFSGGNGQIKKFTKGFEPYN